MEAQEPRPISGRYDTKFDQVPTDFPRPVPEGAVAGVIPKFQMNYYGGKLYSPGCTPPEIFERWDICEDLAQQLRKSSLDAKPEADGNLTEVDILAGYLDRLLKKDWGSEAEMRWVVRRTAQLLNWPAPAAAIEKDA